MRRARLTWEGAFHHVMNRGIDGLRILENDHYKSHFLDILAECVARYKIRLFGFCLMDNHYHLVLENTTNRLGDFMKLLDGSYGNYYRTASGSRGYVFQDRFKSTLIENDSYLTQSILYILQNPVRAALVRNVEEYPYSSIHHYFRSDAPDWLESEFVEETFESRQNLLSSIQEPVDYDSLVTHTKWGDIIGGRGFFNRAVARYNRRKGDSSRKRNRADDRYFEPVEKVIHEFERKFGLDVADVNVKKLNGKRHRAKLLVRLKDLAGLKYSEIVEFDMFSDLQPASLRSIYRNEKKKMN